MSVPNDLGLPPLKTQAESRWVALPPETPLREAACDIVRARSRTVLERIPPVLQKAGEDPEHVHQLRVATRRLAAVLRILRLTTPQISAKKLGSSLRKIRKLCGRARDLDVKHEGLQKLAEHSTCVDGLKDVLDRSHSRRAMLQRRLENQLPDLETEIRLRSERLVAALWTQLAEPGDVKPHPTFAQTGRQVLQQEFDRLRLAAAAWMEDSPAEAPTADLHQLRIACKKFRYAAEVFAGTLPQSFTDDLYPQLQSMQSTLGTIQDAAATAKDLLSERRALEPRWLMWLGLQTDQGAEVAQTLSSLNAAMQHSADRAAAARQELRENWDGFVDARFFTPLGQILAESPSLATQGESADPGEPMRRESSPAS